MPSSRERTSRSQDTNSVVAYGRTALTVVVLAWIESWEDVRRLSRAQYLFWPLAVAAVTMHIQARRIGRTLDRNASEGWPTESR